MNLADRDALVVAKLAQVAPLTGQQAVNEVVRILGFSFAGIMGTDASPTSIASDVVGLQQAVADLTVPTNRTDATTKLNNTAGSTGVRIVPTPKPSTTPPTDHYRMRVVASGN